MEKYLIMSTNKYAFRKACSIGIKAADIQYHTKCYPLFATDKEQAIKECIKFNRLAFYSDNRYFYIKIKIY